MIYEEENFEKLLNDRKYEYILDRACLQFEPDESHYIQVRMACCVLDICVILFELNTWTLVFK